MNDATGAGKSGSNRGNQMSEAAIVVRHQSRSMKSEALGVYVRDELVGIATKLVTIKPYVEELWRRFENGETILGCSTKKEFCEQVLQRTPRAVRYMLEGGNPDNAKQLTEEIISPRTERQADILARIRGLGDYVLAGLFVETFRLVNAEGEMTYEDGCAYQDIYVEIENHFCQDYKEAPDGEPVSWSQKFVRGRVWYGQKWVDPKGLTKAEKEEVFRRFCEAGYLPSVIREFREKIGL